MIPKSHVVIFPVALAIALSNASHAALTFYSPISVSASSDLGTGLLATNLFDADITEASIGQFPLNVSGSSTSNFGDSWAINANFGNEQGVLVLDFGATISFDGLVYAQRTYQGTFVDDFQSLQVWIRDTDPGAATPTLPDTLGTADQAISLSINNLALLRYDFSETFSGRYAILRFYGVDTDPGRGHPGGQELRLFAVPEPSTALLAGAGSLLLLTSRRRGRKS